MVFELSWKKFRVGKYKATAKVHDKPSRHGILRGRISKLRIKTEGGKVIANYDRGWDIKPTKASHLEAVGRAISKYPKK